MSGFYLRSHPLPWDTRKRNSAGAGNKEANTGGVQKSQTTNWDALYSKKGEKMQELGVGKYKEVTSKWIWTLLTWS